MKKEKNIGIIITIISLVLIILGLTGYIIYTNLNKNNNEVPNEVEPAKLKTLLITDNIITELKYPTINDEEYAMAKFVYKDFSLDSMSRDFKMISSTDGLSHKAIEENENTFSKASSFYDATEVKNNFSTIFGPDTKYTSADLEDSICCKIQKYHEQTNTYEEICSCGAVVDSFDHYTKLFKAEQEGDYIYTYFYVQPYIVESELEDGVFFYKRESDKKIINLDEEQEIYDGYIKRIDIPESDDQKEIIEFEINKMLNNNEVDVYKFTFKKQSDNNYYFYSGSWEV